MRSLLPRYVISVVLMILFPLVAVSAEPKNEPAATPVFTPNSIFFNPKVEHESLRLSVRGPDGEVWSRDFQAGAKAAFSIRDVSGPDLDGAYVYELRVAPRVSAAVRQQLKKAREEGDDMSAKRIRRQAGLLNPIVQSGSFFIRNGAIVPPDLKESTSRDSSLLTGSGFITGSNGELSTASAGSPRLRPVANDQVIPDDLIVQASLCVGFDCVNNESFGFDTIRLKENNLRIKFEDTSSTAGFPSSDWQLTANDSASGGANKFSVEDITGARIPFTIEGAATTNSVYIDSTGRIGFRTATPVLDLHANTTDTPAIRLEQNNSGGWTAQTWDVAANEANFFVRDVTGGSRLPFRIRPGAPTSSIDISAIGNVGIGHGTPGTSRVYLYDTTQLAPRLTLAGQEFYQAATTATDGVSFVLGVNRPANRQLWIGDSDALTPNATNKVIRIVPALGEITALSTDTTTAKTLTLNSTGGFVGFGVVNPTFPIHHTSGAHLTVGGSWVNASSRDYKQDISELGGSEALETLYGLTPVKFAYKADPTERHLGFIAEDVPEAVATPDRKGLSSMDVVAVLTKVLQEQSKTIEDLKARIEQLEKER
jgi:hypothetical protein